MSETIDVTTPDGVADAYLATPSEGEVRGGVLLLIDAFGLRPRIEEMAQRIADQGYAVLAPNVFYRAGRANPPAPELLNDPDKRDELFGRIRPLMAALTPEAITADGGAYLDALAEYAPGPAAITGYCLGTRLGLRLAAAYPYRVAAVGGFHGGGLVTDEPDSPHLLAPQIQAELVFGHADNDHSNSPEQIAALDEALDEAGVTHQTSVYEGASHGYTMSDTPAHHEQAAERHFDELFALLDRTVGASSH
jgi:carboxymethylenebutenolidase